MVLRTFFAFDSDNLTVSVSPGGVLGIGSSIINNSNTPNGTVFTYSSGGGATVTIDDDDFFSDANPIDNNLFFNDDDETDHVVTSGGGLVADGQLVEAESTILLRALDGAGNQTGPVIEVTVLSQGGVTGDVWGFGTDTALVDGVSYVKVGGDNDGTVPYSDFITCFGQGTEILTQSGLVPVEQISVGDMVWTRDDGHQPVRWVGHVEVDAQGAFAPVVFAPGAIGNDKELVVSQEHRIYLQDAGLQILFGIDDALIAAKHLCGLPGVAVRPGGSVAYVHLMFDTHQVISGNGVQSESFFLSDLSVSGVNANQRRELLALFPSLDVGMDQFGPTAATTLKGFEAKLFCDHLRGNQTAGLHS